MNYRNWTCKLMAVPMLAGLMVLSGCEDSESRAMLGSASKEIADLKNQVADLKSKSEEFAKKLAADKEDLRSGMLKSVEDAAQKEAQAVDNMLQTLTKQAEETRKVAREITGGTRGDFDAELKNVKLEWAGLLQKLREDDAKTFEELKKFMDNQLRELYPYAYQPRRLDPATPPPAEQK